MIIYIVMALMMISVAFIAYRASSQGPEHHLVQHATIIIVIIAAAWFLVNGNDWIEWVRIRYTYTALGIVFILYGAYAKYKGNTDGYGQ
ncbi:hypothetical protein [Paenibacillus kandeliae]|uniref:hypothetical protein n=1 Tax=Paenibacillus kandeliae TaxID=3231269 RepID=UPI003459B8B0